MSANQYPHRISAAVFETGARECLRRACGAGVPSLCLAARPTRYSPVSRAAGTERRRPAARLQADGGLLASYPGSGAGALLEKPLPSRLRVCAMAEKNGRRGSVLFKERV